MTMLRKPLAVPSSRSIKRRLSRAPMKSRLDAVKPRERMLVRIDVPAMAKIRSISLLVILAWLFVDRVDEKLL